MVEHSLVPSRRGHLPQQLLVQGELLVVQGLLRLVSLEHLAHQLLLVVRLAELLFDLELLVNDLLEVAVAVH